MFVRSDHGLGEGGGAAALSFGRSLAPLSPTTRFETLRARIADIEWAPDLGAQIGSATWWRGALTCTALITATCWLSPGFNNPLIGATPPPLEGSAWEEARAQAIAPLGWGANSGRRIAANDLVAPLAETPERPMIELAATLGSGDNFSRVLTRAGVARDEASSVADMVSRAVALSTIKPGTQLEITLGRRPSRDVPRPLDNLKFRARFDLNVAVARTGGHLVMAPQPIAIDNTPLRIRGLVGQSLYRSARAAGAPAKAVEAYIRALASRISIGRDVQADNIFDIVVRQARAATGEVQLGELLYAGLDRDGKKIQLLRWGGDTDSSKGGQWFEANGVGERRGVMSMPVAGHLTSSYGMRFHPIMRMMRMHKGMDFGAPYGAPIRAAMDGIVTLAGRTSGYGNFVKLTHGGGLATGYGHMSRIAVRSGTRVAQGQIIGYVGSTGMSTGPHLHYEVWRNGVSINPRNLSFTQVAQLSGNALRAFKAKLASLLSVKPAGR
ncbi:MAG: hypothetical protein B7Y43_07710 [Sphingomonas sp. 28-62-20]|uniref:M23 family metallopeptidase n=1 Tax=Sphingomonas sp. 28-62-20 TaxID=1970433 RepID=UPI000BCE238E|nr:MAG: hypothetical protein B7Y43_07710 [Sphingomonas sp. 28-62-20]